MGNTYPHVFSSIRIGPVEVKNRLYMPPHGLLALVAAGPHGSMVPSADYAYYLAERAAGGVGLLFHPMTTLPRIRNATPLYEESIPSFKVVADFVHRNGAKLMAQINMMQGAGLPWEPLGGMIPQNGPSDGQSYGLHATTRAMKPAEIEQWVDATGRCARNLTEAGYDGVELSITHGSVAEMFLSPYFNKRDDAYGGSVEGRMRVLVDLLRAVRRNISAHMAAGIRLNSDEMLPGGLTQDDTREILRRLVDLGLLDFVDLDVAVEPQQQSLMLSPVSMPPLHIVPFSSKVGQAVKGRIVVMGPGGHVTAVAQAERLIADGLLDMVGAVRQQLAEPEFMKNALEGHEDHSRTCVRMNYCLGSGLGAPRTGFGCVINPATGRERKWGVQTFATAATPSKVVVIGAGIAGMEAARVAAKLGHEVVVLERRGKVGGQLNLWAGLPGREELRTTVDWYRRQLDELGVPVRTGVEATASMVLAEKPNAVLVATGSRYVASGESAYAAAPIPGADRDFVYTPERILEDGARPAGRILLLDEERINTSWGTAEVLARAGAQVEIITRDTDLVGNALTVSKDGEMVVPRLLGLGVKITVATYIKAIGDHEVTVFHTLSKQEEVRKVDAVVLATMRRADTKLASELEGKVDQLYVIGDALAPRFLYEATYEGQRFARLVGQHGAPRDMTEAQALFTEAPDDVQPRPASSLLELAAAR